MDFYAPFSTFLRIFCYSNWNHDHVFFFFYWEERWYASCRSHFFPQPLSAFVAPFGIVPAEVALGSRISCCFVFLISNLSQIMQESGQWMFGPCSRLQMFFKIEAFKNFTILNLQGFSVEYCKIFTNNVFYRTSPLGAF